MTATQALLYSLHSFRIGLACALRAAKAPDWVILAVCRWRSTSSIPVYGRINFGITADWIDEASIQNVSSLQVANFPGIPSPKDALGSIPNALPDLAYDFLNSAIQISEDLTTLQLDSLSSELPEIDDDIFMNELSQCSEATPDC